jgi:ferredoxin-type protein NapH
MTSAIPTLPGSDPVPRRVSPPVPRERTWLVAHRWLILRRLSQISILALFLAGPLFSVWLVKGNLASSLLLDLVPMTDPFLLSHLLAAGHWPATTAWTGAAVVLVAYLLLGGRSYCAWVCPVNPVTDLAAWLRRQFGLKSGKTLARSTRYWLLVASLIATALSGVLVWEWVNPVSMLHRAIIFGGGLAWLIVVAVFAYDLLIAARGWCGHLCPMGAFYSLLGHGALLRVSAHQPSRCNDCMDCFVICPEPQIIRPALKGTDSPVIADGACTNCGRCIEVCPTEVFRFTHRFDIRRDAS